MTKTSPMKNLGRKIHFVLPEWHLFYFLLLFWLGACVWKAKNGSGGSTGNENPSNRPGSESQLTDAGPGKSFRNFKFDSAYILQAMEAAFANWNAGLISVWLSSVNLHGLELHELIDAICPVQNAVNCSCCCLSDALLFVDCCWVLAICSWKMLASV